MMVYTYTDIDEWWSDIMTHGCGVGKLMSFDDPKNLQVGYGCRGCDDVFRIGVNHVRRLPDGNELREGLRGSESRADLPIRWQRGVVLLEEEW